MPLNIVQNLLEKFVQRVQCSLGKKLESRIIWTRFRIKFWFNPGEVSIKLLLFLINFSKNIILLLEKFEL